LRCLETAWDSSSLAFRMMRTRPSCMRLRSLAMEP
jgi:hypothetical protein